MTVIVTGAASGIGRACAENLSLKGEDVKALDVEPIGSGRSSARVSKIDIRNKCDFEEAIGSKNALKGFIACAALPPTHSNPLDILQTNFISTMENVESFIAGENKGAAIVLFSSIAAFRKRWPRPDVASYLNTGKTRIALEQLLKKIEPPNGYEAYCLSKRLIFDFARAAAKRAGTRGVRLNCLVLGPTESAAVTRMQSESPEEWDYLASECPLGAPIFEDEVTSLVTLVMSNSMPHLSGSHIFLDGGWSAEHLTNNNESGNCE